MVAAAAVGVVDVHGGVAMTTYYRTVAVGGRRTWTAFGLLVVGGFCISGGLGACLVSSFGTRSYR